jgi:uncharacterized protein (DUF1800 family)
MRAARFLLAVFLALAALAARAEAIGYEGARHLLNRTGFGATDAEVRAFCALPRVGGVARRLALARREAKTAPPEFVATPIVPFRTVREMDTQARKDFRRTLVEQGLELRAWWIGEMLATPSPLTERMTLFWHNHFATSQQKVRYSQLMYRQNALLRRESLGNFATLLHEMAKDPAMLIWLDNAGNRRQAPNENFAREVMELFTLGEGHYGESDVKEAARAFTGWSLDRDTGAYVNRRMWHDGGMKTVLGASGEMDGDAVLDLLLAQPHTARFVVAKLWREFVSPTPQEKEVAALAQRFREARYEVKPLMRALLLSDAFWDPRNRGALVKSPADVVVGTLHTFGMRPQDLRPAAIAMALLGQNLFSPPNVKGWPGGDAWIDSATLLGRHQFMERLLRGGEGSAMRAAAMTQTPAAEADGPAFYRRVLERGAAGYTFDAVAWSDGFGDSAKDQVRMRALLLALPPAREAAADDGAGRVRAFVNDPVYQLR